MPVDHELNCPQCAAVNRPGARFCDQCGTPLTGPGAAPAIATPKAAKSAQRWNWLGLLLVAAIIGACWWLLIDGGQSGETAGVDSAPSTNPHGDAAEMDNLQAELDQARQQLADDPLDAEALLVLYQNYGMIGRAEEVRPYLDSAVKALADRAPELADDCERTGMNLAMAAIVGGDVEGALGVLLKLHELLPESLSTLKLLGDVQYNLDDPAAAIDWYTQYLERATPEAQGDEYWSARIDRATMYMHAGEMGEVELSAEAVVELRAITAAKPDYFNAWFNLVQALMQTGDLTEAREALASCEKLAAGDDQFDLVEQTRGELEAAEAGNAPGGTAAAGEAAAP